MLSGIGIAFYRGPALAAIYVAYLPFIVMSMLMFGGRVRKATIERIVVSKKLGGTLEESLSAIKLIVSFAQEEKEIKKVEEAAENTRRVGQNASKWLAVFMSVIRMNIFGFFVYAIAIGSVFIQNHRLNERTK